MGELWRGPWLYRRSPSLWYGLRPAQWTLRLATSPLRATPDVLLIGAPRCSTTSMFWALVAHPGIAVPWEKEPHYFDAKFHRGSWWYRANFGLRASLRRNRQLAFEATPSLLPHPEAPGRVHGLCPDAKLLVLLRDPVERAHSEWALFCSLGWEHREFEAVVRASLDHGPPSPSDVAVREAPYLRSSRYVGHLDRWVELFGRERLLVLSFDVLVSDPSGTLRSVLRFLGLDASLTLPYPSMNARTRAPLEASLRGELDRYFAPSLDELHVRYGIDLRPASSPLGGDGG